MTSDTKTGAGPSDTHLQRTQIAQFLQTKEDIINKNLHILFRSLAFDNDHTLNPGRLSELPQEEFRHLIDFIQDNNPGNVYRLGRARAEEGLNIKSVLGLGSWLTRFFLDSPEIESNHLTNTAMELMTDYMTPYIDGYCLEKTNKTIRQQKEIRSALSAALFGQQNELFIRNHSLASSINAILLSDLSGRVTYVNTSFLKLWGYTSIDDVLAVGGIDQLVGVEVENIFQSLSRERTWRGELRLSRPNGTDFEVEMAASLIIDEHENQFGMMASFVDITERKRMAAQLNRSRKMEALGQLAAGITHDFNNMFAVVKGYLQLILRDADKGSQLFDDVKQIQVAIERSSGLTKQLQYFARGVEGERSPIDMNAIIEEGYTLLSHAFPPGIDITLNLQNGLWMIEADASQMSHTIINLCVNARDAIIEGYGRLSRDGDLIRQKGTIAIATRNRILDEACTKIHMKATPGRYIHVSVSDSGIGMNQDVLERLFEPFYSTKKSQKNAGLGLSIIYGIVDKLNGFIDVQSKFGEGSIFHLYLPASNASGIAETIEEEVLLPVPNENTVLIVDDEPQILQILTRFLTATGYDVITAKNGKEAVSIFDKEKERIGVVILDMIMPEMDGEMCLKALREIDADVGVILTTGFTTDESIIRRMKEQSEAVIEKPFDLDMLSLFIKRILLKKRHAAFSEADPSPDSGQSE